MKEIINKIKNKEKGFTLIEIIVVIALISILGVGSVVGINYASNKNEEKKIEKAYKKFDDALEVYLSNHPEIYTNLKDNVEGAVITLEVLKNEGLVAEGALDQDNKPIDYKDSYYVLSDAVLLENPEGETGTEENLCDGRVGLNVLKSWKELTEEEDLTKEDIIYICPKSDTEETKDNTEVEDLKKRLESLENSISLLDLGGEWVLFDVSTDKGKLAYWPDNETQDLWSVVSSEGGQIKLLYNQYVPSNNKNYCKKSEIQFLDLKEADCDIYQKSVYNRYSDRYNWEIMSESDISKIKLVDSNYYDAVYDRDYRHTERIVEYNNTYYRLYRYNSYKKNNGKYLYYCRLEVSVGNTSFYCKTNNGNFVKYKNDSEWTGDEVVNQTYKTAGSKKKDLYTSINGSLEKYIIESNYYYDYDSNDSSSLEVLNKGATFKDKIGTLSTNDNIDDIGSILIGKSFIIGTYNVGISFDTYTGYALMENANLGRYKINKESDYSEGVSLMGSSSGKYYYTYNYIPVINIKDATILNNLDDYPDSYKNKYKDCTNDKLGTKECPKIFKFTGGEYSNG